MTNLELLRKGNTEAWQSLYTDLGPGLFRFIMSKLGDASAAEDILQEGFVRLSDNLDSIRDVRAVKSWLYTTCKRLTVDWLRKAREIPTEDLESKCSEPPPDEDPSNVFMAAETAHYLKEALATLSSEQREVVVLRLWSGLTYSEISKQTGIPETTLRSQYYWAIRKLRRCMRTIPGLEKEDLLDG